MHVNGFIPEHGTVDAPSFDKFKTKFSVRAASTGEHIIPEYTPLSDQGDWPSCTMNAALDTAEALIGLENPSKVVQLSRRAGWWVARRREGTEKQIVGVRLSTAFRVLEEVGACPEDMWPYEMPADARNPDGSPMTPEQWMMQKPKLAALESMSDNKLLGWARIYETGDAILDAVDYALLANHPVDYGTAIDDPFRFATGAEVLRPPEDPKKIIGRHAIAIFGRRVRAGRREYWIRNSWGPTWAMGGHVWVDQDYLTWADAMNHTVGTKATEII